jgi:hypothetical protein
MFRFAYRTPRFRSCLENVCYPITLSMLAILISVYTVTFDDHFKPLFISSLPTHPTQQRAKPGRWELVAGK